jgi:hypothetical protein
MRNRMGAAVNGCVHSASCVTSVSSTQPETARAVVKTVAERMHTVFGMTTPVIE